MKIGIIVGSLRKESYNRKIADYIVKNYSDLADLEIIEIKDFPLFNEDLEGDNTPEIISSTRANLKEKDGVIIVTPEYNYTIPGPLKNALDWFSRDNLPLMKKPYMLMGASMGSIGTARAQLNVREILNSTAFKMYSLPNNEFLFANISKNMDEEGNLTNERSVNKLASRMKEFISFVEMVNIWNK